MSISHLFRSAALPAFLVAALVIAPTASADPIDRLTEPALEVRAQTPTGQGLLQIPKSALAILAGGRFQWDTGTAQPLVDIQGRPIAFVSGTVLYDTATDAIGASFSILAASEDVRITITSSSLINARSAGAEVLEVKSSLRDLGGAPGATVSAVAPAAGIASTRWNSAIALAALPDYSADAGNESSRNDIQSDPMADLSGTKTLVLDFTLTANDQFVFDVDSTSTIPAPASLAALAAMTLLTRRQPRRH